MSNTIIRVENLSKKYVLGHEKPARYTALRDVIVDRAKAIGRRLLRPTEKGESDRIRKEFWALKDISFEVKQGEVIGIIGRNGAGKSTLLKILSCITEPTQGRLTLKGRVASLLEVGTGFHPELTGRENIYLNGAILGMTKVEISKTFDEIVAFAEVESFLDTPVKHYSSGMYMRLAFAVAAHLEPEILVVDEVLAVGDVAFQKKCLGKMTEVSQQEGRTILFVSHNLAAISQLCNQAILLEQGRVKEIGCVSQVITEYTQDKKNQGSVVDLTSYKLRQGTQQATFKWAELLSSGNKPSYKFSIGDDVVIKFCFCCTTLVEAVKLAVQIRTSDGINLCNMIDLDSNFRIKEIKETEVLSVTLKDIRLYPGIYYISLWIGSLNSLDVFDYIEDCLCFEIVDGGKLTIRSLPRHAGLLFMTPDWKHELM